MSERSGAERASEVSITEQANERAERVNERAEGRETEYLHSDSFALRNRCVLVLREKRTEERNKHTQGDERGENGS